MPQAVIKMAWGINLFNRNRDNFGTLGNATDVFPGFSNPRFLSPGMPRGEWISLTYDF